MEANSSRSKRQMIYRGIFVIILNLDGKLYPKRVFFTYHEASDYSKKLARQYQSDIKNGLLDSCVVEIFNQDQEKDEGLVKISRIKVE